MRAGVPANDAGLIALAAGDFAMRSRNREDSQPPIW